MRRANPTQAAARQIAGQWIAASATDVGLVYTVFDQRTQEEALDAVFGRDLPEGPLALQAAKAIAAYIGNRIPIAELPLDLRHMPDFAAAVLATVARIPFGQTRTYGEVAAEAGRPRAARAVGQVMAHNPLAPVVPCHRVVGVKNLVGYGGGTAGLPRKRALLESEGVRFPITR